MSKPQILPSWVKVGRGLELDDNVVIGYLPCRKVSDQTLTIGDNAKVRHGSIIYAGSRIGNDLETGHNVIIREENVIGDNLRVWSNSVIDYGCRIGNDVKIHCNCYVAQLTVIEDKVFLAPGVMIANEKYPTGSFLMERIKGPIIKKGANIGMNATILPGITIGENALVGAGSVVTRDIPSSAVAYGNPARVFKSIFDLQNENILK